MKRSLVDYSTSSESEKEQESTPPAKKRKRLPTLSSNLIPNTPKDDPSLHQGRIRSQPFVDGQFATHIYAAVPVITLGDILESVIAEVRATCKDLEIFSLLEDPKRGDSDNGPVDVNKSSLEDLHLSLSRPLFLRSHQREAVTRAVKEISRQTTRFTASFASFGVLNNDESTRSFLVIEVGAGHAELSNISTALTPLLTDLRQPAYYTLPRYHVSIGWILTTTQDAPRFPENLTQILDDKFGDILRGKSVDIEEICTKIGKAITRCNLVI